MSDIFKKKQFLRHLHLTDSCHGEPDGGKTGRFRATDLWFAEDKMYVSLDDGREIAVPVEWFPTLRDATKSQRENWRFIGGGEGIHWEDLDEDILVEGLL